MNEKDKEAMLALFGPPPSQVDPTPVLFNERAQLEAKRVSKTREGLIEDSLPYQIEHANYLNSTLKDTYLKLAELYLSDLEENILSNHFTLQKKYPTTTVDEWANFLRDKVVYTYIRKHRDAMLVINAEKNLVDPYARNKRDNLSLIRSIEGSDTTTPPIVILRIPDKYGTNENN